VVSESRSLRDEEDLDHAKMGQANKNKSMVLQKQEDELKARVLRLARKNYNSLGTFIRLIDYMVTETQVKINQESIELILFEMNNTKKYNINTQVSFDAKDTGKEISLSFNPAKIDFITAFNKLLEDMENVASEILRIISHPNFNQFIQGLISDGGGKFKEIVADSFRCKTAKEAIGHKIEADFKVLMADVQKIENCRDVHDFTQKNFERDLKPEFRDLDSIKTWIDRLSNWEKLIASSIRNQYVQGLVSIMGKNLREALVTKVKKEQGNIRTYLFDMTNSKAKEIQNGLNHIRTVLQKPAHSLQTFVDYVNSLKMCKNQKDNIIDDKKRLEEMNMTLKKFRSKEDQSFNTQLQVLQQKLEDITNEISAIELILQQSEGTVTENKDTYVGDVDTKINEEKERLA